MPAFDGPGSSSAGEASIAGVAGHAQTVPIGERRQLGRGGGKEGEGRARGSRGNDGAGCRRG